MQENNEQNRQNEFDLKEYSAKKLLAKLIKDWSKYDISIREILGDNWRNLKKITRIQPTTKDGLRMQASSLLHSVNQLAATHNMKNGKWSKYATEESIKTEQEIIKSKIEYLLTTEPDDWSEIGWFNFVNKDENEENI